MYYVHFMLKPPINSSYPSKIDIPWLIESVKTVIFLYEVQRSRFHQSQTLNSYLKSSHKSIHFISRQDSPYVTLDDLSKVREHWEVAGQPHLKTQPFLVQLDLNKVSRKPPHGCFTASVSFHLSGHTRSQHNKLVNFQEITATKLIPSHSVKERMTLGLL